MARVEGKISQDEYRNYSVQQGKQAAKGAGFVASLFIPGPEDLAIGAFAASKIGQGASRLLGKIGGEILSKGDDVLKKFDNFPTQKCQLQLNREAGDVGENFLKNTYGGEQQVSTHTTHGRRFIDNLTESGVAQESKVGRVSASERILTQIRKDVELANDRSSAVKKVEWHFFQGKTGIGPTKPLQKILDENNIQAIIHK